MQFKTHKLRDAITFALVAGATSVAGTSVAFAQDSGQGATTLDRIEVTGSRIRQVDIETSQPVLMISREEIENQGFSTVADILQNVSAAGSPAFSRASPLTANAEAGGSYIDLRNLGATRTLVLVNGKRLGISTAGYQDISTIPSSVVERIEVLKDGASSIYGSDAMAGVINIITRKNFDGAEVNAYFGQYDEGDGTIQSYDFVTGFSGDRGSVTIGAEYHKEEEVWAKDRWFSADSYPGYPQYSNTVVGQWGNWRRSGTTDPWMAPNRGSDALDESDFHPQTSEDTSRASDQMHLRTPQERRSLFATADFEITDNIRFVSDMAYNQRDAFRQIAGYPTQSTAIDAPMHADSVFNPVGEQIDWRRRGWEVPRTTQSDLTTWRFTAALEGSFDIGDRYFDWDAGTLYNKTDLKVINNGNFYKPHVRNAVGPSFVNAQGQIVCGTPDAPIADCVAWNPFAGFGTGAVEHSLDDPRVQNYLFKQEHALGETETNSYFANLAGSLFSLPAGDLGFAVGYEYRKEQGGFFPDAIAQSGDSTNLASGPTYGSYQLDEFYAELNIPVLADVAFAQELTFNVASRYSDFDTFGDTTNNKFGLKWRPVDDLLVRATYAEGFRAPTISNLYGGGSQTFTTGFRDPCDSVYGEARGSARCLQDVAADYRQLQQGFVPTDGPAAQTPVPFTSGSNPNLSPETSESKNLGIVYSPSFVEGLSVAVDWWNIRIEDTLVSDTPNLMLSDCYVALIESRCAGFTRDPVTGIVNDLTYGLRNAGYYDTEGYDVDLGYRINTDYGRFGAQWQTTYVSKYEVKSTNDFDAVPSQYNGFSSYFRIRSNLNLNWNLGDFGSSLGFRYYSGVKESCTFDEHCNLPDYQAPDTQGNVTPQNRVGSVTFTDLQFSWNAPWNAKIAIGANNVFDRTGPVMYSQPNSNYSYYGGYDIGRFMYVKYQQRF
ncbi:TonB-dependent receptor plug domain-containing protein [Novilysobacter defluvii]|uniref:TonB-dependent receptor n=1 Tax=Lysobacter defluvii IMMIB APB-9 = DSM 18482 TaxID=1385515 RepID=A0A0A0MA08_9GAMM|nr:TonB-dependent receptor [Lysobacter defluvii]KGO99074.1 TonB-dependent receptor [Lysobacter defluvii IMMIB APB-9 = DSM 18482]